jgi:16S rRNA (cytidine1402-2'-O)-methyltransferase
MICYESAKRLSETLADIAAIAPNRLCAVARELTKTYDESWLDDAQNLAEHFAVNGAPKGEIVLMFAPPAGDENTWSDQDIIKMLKQALDQELSRRDAVRAVCQSTGIGKTRIYDLMLSLDQTSS